MAQDIIDAEFETVRRDGEVHPTRLARNPATPPAPVPAPAREDQIGILKSAARKSVRPGMRAHALYLAAVTLAAFAAFYVSGGYVLFRTADTAPAHGRLALEVAPAPQEAGMRQRADVVTVSATIRNGTASEKRIPDVLLTFSSGSSTKNLVYRVPRGETLQPGKTLAFTVRMPKKPGYAQAPRLTFDNSGV